MPGAHRCAGRFILAGSKFQLKLSDPCPICLRAFLHFIMTSTLEMDFSRNGFESQKVFSSLEISMQSQD
jgi:hypothetical protein